MTSEWMADALMREWECQSLPRSKERANHATGNPADAEGGAVPSANEQVSETSADAAPPSA